MRQYIFEKHYPSLSYIANNWPRSKHLLKKFVLSNQKKPDFYEICTKCLNDLNIFKIRDYSSILKKNFQNYVHTILLIIPIMTSIISSQLF